MINPEETKRPCSRDVDPVERRTGLTPEEVRALNYNKLFDFQEKYQFNNSLSKIFSLSLVVGGSLGAYELYQEHIENPSIPLALVSFFAIALGYWGKKEIKEKNKTLEEAMEELKRVI